MTMRRSWRIRRRKRMNESRSLSSRERRRIVTILLSKTKMSQLSVGCDK